MEKQKVKNDEYDFIEIDEESDEESIDFPAALKRLKEELDFALNRYKEKSSDNSKQMQDWEEKCKIVRDSLNELLDSITNPYLKKVLKEELNNPDNFFDEEKGYIDGDLGRLYFYIDTINKVPVNIKILKYNDNYCRSAIAEICKEYYEIEAHLDGRNNNYKYNSTHYSEQVIDRIRNSWQSFLTDLLPTIVETEYKNVLSPDGIK